MLRTAFIVVVFMLPAFISSKEKCPSKYKKLSKHHSFCLPKNKKCNIFEKGVPEKEIDVILKAHNKYRSKVATGKEKKGGGLPKASNMTELTWNKELQKIAQKWAQQCKFEHDCNDCRRTNKSSVGQNIAQHWYSCKKQKCDSRKPEWKRMIKKWYKEVDDFKKKLVSSYKSKKKYGHFSQLIWAETKEVGCGYVVFKKEKKRIFHLYVCNYAPAGNIKKKPIYEEGKICSKCPKNSCCGKTCKEKKGKKTYPGLCRLNEK